MFLPFPYVSAGGSEAAFQEMYGWDTYFINLGLLAHERPELVRGHVLNQLSMVERFGMVLNGNSTAFLHRGQPPLLPESVREYYLATRDADLLLQAYPLLKKEYRGYWCAPHHSTPTGLATNRNLGDPNLHPELSAEAETGLDFCACFRGDIRKCNPLITNCVLTTYARTLGWAAAELGRPADEARGWRDEAEKCAAKIRELCWDEAQGFFFDYDFVAAERVPVWSLSGFWPLWSDIATPEQARRMVANLARFEHAGGLAFTDVAYPSPHPEFTWLQWGYPSGWPCMHLMVVRGLARYGFHAEAERIAAKFLAAMIRVHDETGKLWEKYNVVDGNLHFPVERYVLPPIHGWTSASVALLGRFLFPPAA